MAINIRLSFSKGYKAFIKKINQTLTCAQNRFNYYNIFVAFYI